MIAVTIIFAFIHAGAVPLSQMSFGYRERPRESTSPGHGVLRRFYQAERRALHPREEPYKIAPLGRI
jgi:hypothetical protein